MYQVLLNTLLYTPLLPVRLKSEVTFVCCEKKSFYIFIYILCLNDFLINQCFFFCRASKFYCPCTFYTIRLDGHYCDCLFWLLRDDVIMMISVWPMKQPSLLWFAYCLPLNQRQACTLPVVQFNVRVKCNKMN